MKKLTELTRWQNQVLALVSAVLLFSCSHLEPFQMESDDALRARFAERGGNVECSDLDISYEKSFKYNYDKINNIFSVEEDDEVTPPYSQSGFTITYNPNTKTLNWSYDGCLDGISVIVKGGPNEANVYEYESGITEGSGLFAPNNPGGNRPDLSNIHFCFNTCDDDCWDDETAWAGGDRYVLRGNWATYSTYEAGTSVNIYADQDKFVGTATFGPKDVNDMITISIDLTTGDYSARFEDITENLKIQGYIDSPSGNPAPGLFTTSKTTEEGTFASVQVAYFPYYGIHLNVEIACEEEEE